MRTVSDIYPALILKGTSNRLLRQGLLFESLTYSH